LRKEFNSDSGRIKQILINLISNSFKFTSRGYISLKIEHLVERSFVPKAKHLRFIVEDTGIGISINYQANLFKVFGMVQKHRDSFNCRGTGLGLTISQKLANLLGGEITLESEEEKGTKVSFTVKEIKNIEDYNCEVIKDDAENVGEDEDLY
jgi:signal transduction histidine kinase